MSVLFPAGQLCKLDFSKGRMITDDINVIKAGYTVTVPCYIGVRVYSHSDSGWPVMTINGCVITAGFPKVWTGISWVPANAGDVVKADASASGANIYMIPYK